MIDHYVGRGSHFVGCQLLGEEGQSVPMFNFRDGEPLLLIGKD